MDFAGLFVSAGGNARLRSVENERIDRGLNRESVEVPNSSAKSIIARRGNMNDIDDDTL